MTSYAYGFFCAPWWWCWWWWWWRWVPVHFIFFGCLNVHNKTNFFFTAIERTKAEINLRERERVLCVYQRELKRLHTSISCHSTKLAQWSCWQRREAEKKHGLWFQIAHLHNDLINRWFGVRMCFNSICVWNWMQSTDAVISVAMASMPHTHSESIQ